MASFTQSMATTCVARLSTTKKIKPSRCPTQARGTVQSNTLHARKAFFTGASVRTRAMVPKPRARSAPLRVVAETTEADRNMTVPLPQGPSETVRQARDAINRAISDGKLLIDVEFLLPLIGATDLDDWPGGIRQQFKAACPMVEEILKGIPGVIENGGCKTEILDQADAIGQWEGKSIAAVLFPSAETVDYMIDLRKKSPTRPLMTINTQWNPTGQIISDFGWGPWKEKRENFIAEFTPAYFLKQSRILGENVRIVRAYPGKWQVFAIAEGTQAEENVAELDEKPTYKELEELLKAREGSMASMDSVTRAISEFKFNADSLEQKPPK